MKWFSGNRTALQSAMKDGGGLDVRHAWLALSSLLMVVTLVLLWQAFLVLREERDAGQIRVGSANARQAIAGQIKDTHLAAATALSSPNVAEGLMAGDDAGRQRATAAVRKAVPSIFAVEFYSANLDEVIATDFAKFGYARADMLLNAYATGKEAPVRTQVVQGNRYLALAHPVRAGDALIGHAYLLVPYGPLAETFRATADVPGYSDLRQGQGTGNDLVLEALGDTNLASIAAGATLPIEGSELRIGTAAPVHAIWLPRSPFLILAAAILTILAMLAALWVRRHGMHVATSKARGIMRRQETTDEGETTFAEALQARREAQRADPNSKAKARAAAKAAATSAPAPASEGSSVVDRSIFRAYDIRGVVGTSLTPTVARLIGRAVGSMALARDLREVCVGRDGRLSGPELTAALIEGLRAAGCDVIDIGMAPTPVLYFATFQLNTGSGVMVTGSHNPADYNGFKIVLGGESLSGDAIQEIYERIAEDRFVAGRGGLQTIDVLDDYVERIASDVQLERPLKVVVDCGNGVPGMVAPQVLQKIGCEVIPLFCDVDGTFPNHHPDPSETKNLKDLIMSVKQLDADLGLAFDGDGDRLGVVTKQGEIIWPDRVLMLFAMDVLTRNPGATIIYDVKCTGHLAGLILKHGGSPVMWKTGHSLIKNKMRETDAELAGEMSGHFFFRERWYGFDDAIYSAARLLEILAADGRPAKDVFAQLPKGVSTPELKVPMREGEHYRFIDRFREKASFDGARITTIDGVRADYSDGWGLVRCSNTTPCLVLRFDADSDAALLRITDVFRKQLLSLDPNLQLPF